MNFESQACFKFCMFSGSKAMILDVYNRGKLSNLTHLVSKKHFSGHDWTINTVRVTQGFSITTNLLGEKVWLDVVVGGEFDGLLRLVPENKFSGRVWQIKEHDLEQSTYSIATLINGVYKYMDIHQKGEFSNMAFLVNKTEISGNFWKFLKVDQQRLKIA